jgi:hypothetical protein
LINVPNEYLDQCRNALSAEQEKSLAETNGWSHVDKQKVHVDWSELYKTLSVMVDVVLPSSPDVQEIMAKHYSIACRFYVPSKEAYIGMAIFYEENESMRVFHNSYHPRMVSFLGDAMYIYAQNFQTEVN